MVATDDARIADHAAGFGAEVVMTSSEARNGTERCAEVAERLPGFDVIVNLQGDAPLTPAMPRPAIRASRWWPCAGRMAKRP